MSEWQVILNASVVVFCALCLTMAVCCDPGYLKPGPVDFLNLLEVSDSTQLCPDCKAVRTSRSRHCSVCNRCIERFDHHCPWINNCVGLGNHNYFYLFVVSMFIVLAISLSHAFYCLGLVIEQGYHNISFWDSYIKIPPSIFFVLVSIQIMVTALFFLPVLWLVCV